MCHLFFCNGIYLQFSAKTMAPTATLRKFDKSGLTVTRALKFEKNVYDADDSLVFQIGIRTIRDLNGLTSHKDQLRPVDSRSIVSGRLREACL